MSLGQTFTEAWCYFTQLVFIAGHLCFLGDFMIEDCNRIVELIRLIHSRKIGDTHRTVLVAMAGDANPVTGYMQLSIERLAWLLDKSESQARRDLQSVVTAGLLTTIKASKGRFPSVYAFNPDAAQPKQITRGSDRVDYTQPTRNTAGDDRVSDSQPTTIDLDSDRDDRVDRVGTTPQIVAGDGRVKVLGSIPPKNPLNTRTNANTDSDDSAREDVKQIVALIESKRPGSKLDTKDIGKLIDKYQFEPFRAELETALNLPAAENPIGLARYRLDNPGNKITPPSVSPVSPNGAQPTKYKDANNPANDWAKHKKASGE